MNEKSGIVSLQTLIYPKRNHYYSQETSVAEKDVNEKVCIFAKTIKNILLNFISQGTILCDQRDTALVSNKIKKPTNEKNTAYQSYIQDGKNEQSFQIFSSFKVCYYLHLKFPNNNITHGFLKN